MDKIAGAGVSQRLTSFLKAFSDGNSMSSDAFRLDSFLKEFRRHNFPQQHARVDPIPKLTCTIFGQALDDIKPLIERARSAGELIDPWAIAGLKRHEVRNAGVLAALWTPSLGGDVAVDFLANFLARVATASGVSLPDHSELSKGYLVLTEDCPLGEASERVDITVQTLTMLIGIEIKIDAGEGSRQLARYSEAISQRAKHLRKEARIIFLAPFRSTAVAVLNARWTDVTEAARAILPKKRSERQHNHRLIEHFAKHVRPFEGRNRYG